MKKDSQTARIQMLSGELARPKPDEWLTLHAPGCRLEQEGCSCNSYPIYYGDPRTAAEIWQAADRFQADN